MSYDTKYKIGDFVFWFSPSELLGWGKVEQIEITKDKIWYKIFNEREIGDHPEVWREACELYHSTDHFKAIRKTAIEQLEDDLSEIKRELLERLEVNND